MQVQPNTSWSSVYLQMRMDTAFGHSSSFKAWPQGSGLLTTAVSPTPSV